jgi:hypothetical protein
MQVYPDIRPSGKDAALAFTVSLAVGGVAVVVSSTNGPHRYGSGFLTQQMRGGFCTTFMRTEQPFRPGARPPGNEPSDQLSQGIR